MDFNPNSATNTEADRKEDRLVEAFKTRLGPLPLLCLVTILNLINGFFFLEKLDKKRALQNQQWNIYRPTSHPTNAGQFWL